MAEANEITASKDDMRINCFIRTGCLLHYTKSHADDLIKPQGVKSKIVMPDSHEEDIASTEFTAPVTIVEPEEKVVGNINLNIHHDTVVSDSNDNNELTLCEDEDADVDFYCEDILEDVSASESVEELLNSLTL